MSNKYFIIMKGLRGCYMPDSVNCQAFATRRALKNCLAAEAESQGEGYIGLSKKDIAWAANHAWAKGDTILPFGFKGQGKPYAIELSVSTRKDYLQRLKDEGDA